MSVIMQSGNQEEIEKFSKRTVKVHSCYFYSIQFYRVVDAEVEHIFMTVMPANNSSKSKYFKSIVFSFLSMLMQEKTSTNFLQIWPYMLFIFSI